MGKLKQIIESTLINNLDIENGEPISIESLENTSDYIAQEIKDIAIEFSNWRYTLVFSNRVRQGVDGRMYMLSEEELFNQFINDKYEES